MPFDYAIAASAMQHASQIDRAHLIPAAKLPPARRETLVPFVGWIGPDYAGGTVIVAKDPGGFNDVDAPAKKVSKRDVELDRALEDALLALPTHDDPVAAVRHASHLFLEQLPYNGIRVVLRQIEDALGESLSRMAFFNLCPFRSSGPSLIEGLRRVALPLVPALSADTVLILNKTVAPDLEKLPDPSLGVRWLRVLERKRQDAHGLHANGLNTLKELSVDTGWRNRKPVSPIEE